jgi:DNA-directed RNA polymerase specialized sigma24 family protein
MLADPAGADSGAFWIELRADLVRWLSRRLRGAFDVDDIASEAVMKALQRFGRHEAPPRALAWRWLQRVAQNRLASLVRRAKGTLVLGFGALEPIESAVPVANLASHGPADIVAHLQQIARGTRRRVLDLLPMTNAQMAKEIGVSERAIEQARRWLREQALAIGDSRRSASGPSVSRDG